MFKYALAVLTVVSFACSVSPAAFAEGPFSIKSTSGSKTKDTKKAKEEAEYHFQEAEKFRTGKKYKEAIAEYHKAINSFPNDQIFYKNLGGTYALNNQLPEAEDTLRKGTKLAPKDWLMWNNLAVVYLETNRLDDADRAVTSAEKAGYHVPPGLKDEIKKRRSGK